MTKTILLCTAVLLFLLLSGAGANAQSGFWTRTAGLEGMKVSVFASHPPNHYFVLSNLRLYASSDAGAHWRIVDLDIAPSLALSMTQDSAGRLYVGATSGRILRSDDFGVTWERIGELPAPVWALVVEGNRMYASGLEKLYKSIDAGATWEPMPFYSSSGEPATLWVEQMVNLRPGAAVAMNMNAPYILNTSATRFQQTTDTHGLHWRNVTDIPGGSWYAATDRGVWRADDPRENWSPTGLTEGGIARVVGTSGGTLIALRGSKLLRSLDSGASWEILPTSGPAIPPWSLARLDARRIMLLTATGMHILNTSTGVIAPENLAPIAGTVPALAAGPDGTVYAVTTGSYGRIYRTTDRGAIWYALPSSPTFRSNAALVVRPNGTLVAIADTGLFVSRDAGVTWRLRTAVSSLATRLVSGPDGVVFAFGSADTIFLRSTDDGETWSTVDYQQFRPSRVNDIVVLADGSALLATHRTLYRSTDGGATWATVPAPSFSNTCMAIAPEGTVYLLGATSYRSADDGDTWTPITSPFAPTRPLAAAALSGGRVYATYADGGRFSDNGGVTWREVQTDVGDRVLSALAVNGSLLFAGTEGGGVLLHDGTSNVPVSEHPDVVDMIVSIAPMPARGRILIDLHLPRAGTPVLKLYDVRGAMVRHDRFKPQSEGVVRLDLDLTGLPAGVYVLHAECGAASCSQPIVVGSGMGK